VTNKGWLEPSRPTSPGDSTVPQFLVDKNGRPKFEKNQLTSDGDLPKLFNLDGKLFDIRDIMGQFDKYPEGNDSIDNKRRFPDTDNRGMKVNENGFLIDD